MPRRAFAVVVLLSALFLATCDSGEESPPPTETVAPTVTFTANPTPTDGPTATASPVHTATPIPPSTATQTATAITTSTPGTDLAGDPALDAVIEVVRAGDAAALAELMRLHEVKCTTVQGIGGPPKCWQDGSKPGEVPDGTVVESFPMPVCEFQWQPDVAVAADLLLDAPGEWYAAISVDGPLFGGETFFGEPYLPNPDRGLIFKTPTGPLLLLLEGDAIVYADRFCDGPASDPAEYLEHPAFDAAVTHRGPAWEE